MTPTLKGRWHTRLLLLFTVGMIASFPFALWFEAVSFQTVFHVPFLLVFYVALLGMAWDVLYTWMQTFRWDSDWPPAYQLGAGIVEGAALWALIKLGVIPGVPSELPFWMFFVHYGFVWFVTFLGTQGPLRILNPQWRFRGGQLDRYPPARG